MQRRREDERSVTVSGADVGFSVGESGVGFSVGSTGSVSDSKSYRFIRYSFDKYDIGVIVDSSGKFVGISEVSINKDFLSPIQRIASRSYIDVDEYYRE